MLSINIFKKIKKKSSTWKFLSFKTFKSDISSVRNSPYTNPTAWRWKPLQTFPSLGFRTSSAVFRSRCIFYSYVSILSQGDLLDLKGGTEMFIRTW